VTADDSTDDEVSDEQRCLSNDWSSASRTTQDGTEWRGRTVDRPQRLRPVGSPVTVKSGLVADASSSARLRRRIVPVPCDGDVTNRRCASGGQGAAAAAAAAGAMVESSNVVALNETYDLPPENQVCREFKKLTASERSATETLTAFRDHSFERAGAKSTEGDSISAPPPPLTRSFVVIEPSCGGGAVVIAEDLSLPAFAPVRSPATTTASARMLMNATPSRQAEIREEFNRLRTRSTNGVRERKSPEVVGTHARASHVACACGNCANNNRCKAIEISSRPVVTANLLPPPTASVDSRASCVHCGGQWRDADRNWAVLPSCGSADGNGTGAPRCGPADRAANGIATSWPPAAAAGASSPSQTSEEVERLPCCDSSTPTRIDAPALNISFLSSIHDAWSAPVSPAITASGRKTRVRRNLAASAAAAAAAAGDGDDRQPTKFDFGVADYSEKRLSHRSPSVKRMWHDLSPSSESENDVDRTLADELLKVERSVRMRMQSHLSANNAVFCPGTGRCTKSTCFACQ
jgi:hypothetical protein